MSKDIKKEFLPFYYSDLDAVARHFEEMAVEGWMLKSFDNTCEYERCEPKELRFNVVLCPAKDANNNIEIKPGAREYIEFCEEAGWTFVDHRGPAYAFCTFDKGIPDIVTDEAERIEAVRKAGSRNRFLSIVLIGINSMQLLLRLIDVFKETDPAARGLSIALAAIFGITVVLLAIGLIISRRSEDRWIKTANESLLSGTSVPQSDEGILRRRKASAILFLAAAIAVVVFLFAYSMRTLSPEARAFLAAMLLAAVPFALTPRIFRKKRSAAVKTLIIIGLVIGYSLLTFIILLILSALFNVFQ